MRLDPLGRAQTGPAGVLLGDDSLKGDKKARLGVAFLFARRSRQPVHLKEGGFTPTEGKTIWEWQGRQRPTVAVLKEAIGKPDGRSASLT